MVEIVFDRKSINALNLFEKKLRIGAKQVVEYGNTLFFLIERKDIREIIRKKSEKIKEVGKILKKKVRIIQNPLRNESGIINFVKNLIYPIKVDKIEVKDKEIIIVAGIQERSMLIGRDRRGEKELLDILNKNFDIKKINFVKAESF